MSERKIDRPPADTQMDQHMTDILSVLQKGHQTFTEASEALQTDGARNVDQKALQYRPCLSCGTVENTTGCPRCTLIHWCEKKDCKKFAQEFHADRCSLAFNPIMYNQSKHQAYSVVLPQTLTINVCYLHSFMRDARTPLQKGKLFPCFSKSISECGSLW